MSVDYEKLIVDALIEGVGKSSMLASSLAIRIAEDKRFVGYIIENLNYDILAKYVANEITRRGQSNVYGFSYVSFMKNVQKEAEKALIAKMAEELAFPENSYKK